MSWKSMIFEEDPNAESKPAADVSTTKPTPAIIDSPPTWTPSINSGATEVSVAQEAAGSNEAYNKLKARIDFKNTSAYALLQKYLVPMEDVAVDEKTKYKIVLGQIQKLDKVDAVSLLSAFDGLQTNLQQEQAKFATFIKSAVDSKVTPITQNIAMLNDDIAKLQAEIADKQNQLASLSSQEIDAKAKVSKAESQFKLATNQISQEIEGDRAKYTGLLQG